MKRKKIFILIVSVLMIVAMLSATGTFAWFAVVTTNEAFLVAGDVPLSVSLQYMYYDETEGSDQFSDWAPSDRKTFNRLQMGRSVVYKLFVTNLDEHNHPADISVCFSDMREYFYYALTSYMNLDPSHPAKDHFSFEYVDMTNPLFYGGTSRLLFSVVPRSANVYSEQNVLLRTETRFNNYPAGYDFNLYNFSRNENFVEGITIFPRETLELVFALEFTQDTQSISDYATLVTSELNNTDAMRYYYNEVRKRIVAYNATLGAFDRLLGSEFDQKVSEYVDTLCEWEIMYLLGGDDETVIGGEQIFSIDYLAVTGTQLPAVTE